METPRDDIKKQEDKEKECDGRQCLSGHSACLYFIEDESNNKRFECPQDVGNYEHGGEKNNQPPIAGRVMPHLFCKIDERILLF
jgi:hypothetical protein